MKGAIRQGPFGSCDDTNSPHDRLPQETDGARQWFPNVCTKMTLIHHADAP